MQDLTLHFQYHLKIEFFYTLKLQSGTDLFQEPVYNDSLHCLDFLIFVQKNQVNFVDPLHHLIFLKVSKNPVRLL